MSKGFDLELLKEIFQDERVHLKVGLILDLEVEPDRSVLRASVSLLPEGTEIIARVSWDLVGPDAGIFQFPSKNDLVMVAFTDGHEDNAFIIRRLTSKVDKIPMQAINGHLVLRALSGTKTFLNSDTEVHLTRDGEGDEALVLGNTFKEAYSAHLQIDATHGHIGNLGYNTSPPAEMQDYLDIKDSPVDDESMLSDLAKTEK